jgi:hypothetical protein
MWQLKNIETGLLQLCSVRPQWISGIWECGEFRVTDVNGDLYEVVELPPSPPKVSPVQFKLLFTSPERIAIKASTDPVVQDFFDIVNDPRLTHVDLGLQSTQDALSYLVSVNLLTTERRAEILLGQVQ